MKSQSKENSTWVIIDYNDLVNGKDLKDQIEKAYGPQGHGILFVQNIPGYAQQRRITLNQINQLAHLPKDILQKYQRPQIFHSLGWSHGVEKFQGQVDNSKASYYYNPTTDQAYQVKPQQQQYFSQQEKKFFNSNKWVEELPKLQENVKKLSKQMIEVGTLLALHIDDYARSKVSTYPEKHLHNIIKNSNSHFGRMLHYFPYKQKGQSEDNWCGWHNDHGALTALTSASYTDQNGDEIDFKLKTGGLYAKNRFADKVRIPIPSQMLAFQLGQSMQILSGGTLEATPHCVVQSDQLAGKNVSRNTLAIFMQSGPLEVMKVPQGVDPRNVIEKEAYKVSPLGKRWQNGMLFKKFHQNTLATYS